MQYNELKKVSIKNCKCYYFDDIFKFDYKFNYDFDILVEVKSYENILIYDTWHRALTVQNHYVLGSIKQMIYQFIMELGIQYYLVLKKYDASQNRIRYLISQHNGITYVYSHNYSRLKIDSYDFLPLEKTLTLHNVVILNHSSQRGMKSHLKKHSTT